MRCTTQKLIDQRASIDVRNVDGRSLLHIASDAGRTECVELLIRRGAILDEKTYDGLTPLNLARKKRYFKISALLAIALNEKIRLDDPRELKEAMDDNVLLCSLPRAFESNPKQTFKRVSRLVSKSHEAARHFRSFDVDAAEKINEGALSVQHCLIPMLEKDLPQYKLSRELVPWVQGNEQSEKLSLLESAVRFKCTALVASRLLQEILDARWSIVVHGRCLSSRLTPHHAAHRRPVHSRAGRRE